MVSSSSELDESSASRMVASVLGTNAGASARNRCPERVAPVMGRTVARTSDVESSGGLVTDGVTGRGGSTVTRSGSVGSRAAVVEGLALERKGSAGGAKSAVAAVGGALSARKGLTGRHSSSKVTERLEMTVLVAG